MKYTIKNGEVLQNIAVADLLSQAILADFIRNLYHHDLHRKAVGFSENPTALTVGVCQSQSPVTSSNGATGSNGSS